jgi:putative hydrolase of the HAD superfamily
MRRIRALSLDLDDTLWPIQPTIQAAEQAVFDWLSARCPHVAGQWSLASMRALRDQIASDHPELAHDFGAQRKLSLAQVIGSQAADPAELVEQAFEIFLAARNRVKLYAEVDHALPRLAALLPLISLSNGNADLQRIGLAQHFAARLSARDVGMAKPDAELFHHAARTLDLPISAIAHVGDDPLLDVLGAKAAGMFSIWLNRDGRAWDLPDRPDLEVTQLTELGDWLDQHLATTTADLEPLPA